MDLDARIVSSAYQIARKKRTSKALKSGAAVCLVGDYTAKEWLLVGPKEGMQEIQSDTDRRLVADRGLVLASDFREALRGLMESR